MLRTVPETIGSLAQAPPDMETRIICSCRSRLLRDELRAQAEGRSMGSLVHGCEFSPGDHRTESAPTACSSERQPFLRAKMNKNRRLCPCGSGKAMRECCGAASSPSKLKLERSARILAETGMHADAARALAERAKLSPHNPMIWNDLGVEYLAAGQPDAAYKAFVRAHKVFPDYPTPPLQPGGEG